MSDEDYIQGIEETGDRNVFLVPSHTSPRIKYRVDVTGNSGAMHCQCPSFSIKKQPRIDAGELPITKDTLCIHCTDLIYALARQHFKRLSEEESE